MILFKQLAAQLPERWQSELKRLHCGRQIRNGTFETDEPEYKILHQFINPGDWVIDIGANVGHYTRRFSELVGSAGRVIAFEPVPTTFALLAANVQLFPHANVTLINAAASNQTHEVGISIPKFSTGLSNYYQAQLSAPSITGELVVLTLQVDFLKIRNPIALVKIDAEGHEHFVLKGMQRLIEQYRPLLIVETGSEEIIASLSAFGYVAEKLLNSPNILFKPKA